MNASTMQAKEAQGVKDLHSNNYVMNNKEIPLYMLRSKVKSLGLDLTCDDKTSITKPMKKDWVKDSTSTFTTLGASNHCDHEREANDYYATHPKAVEMLCDLESFNKDILEPCCGEGHISKVLENKGYCVTSRDIIDRGFGEVADFLSETNTNWTGDIVTNPPFKLVQEFVEKSMEIIPNGNKVAMFLRLLFLEGKSRKTMFEKYPPKFVYVSSSRLSCAKGGDFEKKGSNAMAFAWYVWEKGYHGDTIIKWFN